MENTEQYELYETCKVDKKNCAPNKHSPFILCGEKDDGMDLVPWERVWGISGNVIGWLVGWFFFSCIFLIIDW